MTPLTTEERTVAEREIWYRERPITFDEWLEICGPKDLRELVDGVSVERLMVQLEHEKLEIWLIQLLGMYIAERDRGILLGFCSPVQISAFRGRMPDLFFVRKSRMDIVEQKATRGYPDLIIEIVSPNDRPSDLRALETDYRAIGVEEIVFIDQPKRMGRVLRREESGYVEETLTEGTLRLITVDNLPLLLSALFDEPRPGVLTLLQALLEEANR